MNGINSVRITVNGVNYTINTVEPEEYVQKLADELNGAVREEGGESKLIHDKKQGVFIWNQIRESAGLGTKAAAVKKGGYWMNVRHDYLELKNDYLSQGDKHHPSFVVYIQAVNQVYYAMKTGN